MIKIIIVTLLTTLPLLGGHAILALVALAIAGILAIGFGLLERPEPMQRSYQPIRDRRGAIRLDLYAQ